MKRITVFKTACGQEGGDGREELTRQLHTCLEGEAIRNILEWGGGALGGDHQVGGCGLSGCSFYTCGCFLFRLPSSRFSCGGFRLRLLRPGRLPGGGHFRLPGHLRDRLRSGFWIGVWGWIGGGLDNMPPSNDEIPPLAQVHLLRRGPRPLSFWRGRLACGGALSDTLGRLLCMGRLRPLPINTAPVVRLVVAPAATALRLLPRCRAPTGKVVAPSRDAPGRVSAVTLRVTEALAALALQWFLWGTYDSTDTRRPQSSLIDCCMDT